MKIVEIYKNEVRIISSTTHILSNDKLFLYLIIFSLNCCSVYECLYICPVIQLLGLLHRTAGRAAPDAAPAGSAASDAAPAGSAAPDAAPAGSTAPDAAPAGSAAPDAAPAGSTPAGSAAPDAAPAGSAAPDAAAPACSNFTCCTCREVLYGAL